jgi:hypothetical protein
MLKRLHHHHLLLWHVSTLHGVNAILAAHSAHSGPI